MKKDRDISSHSVQKNYPNSKGTVNRTKRQCPEWEKSFTNLTSDGGLITKIYKELKKLDINTLNYF